MHVDEDQILAENNQEIDDGVDLVNQLESSGEQQPQFYNIRQEENKINLSMALKFLNDPSYGQTIEQRKATLRSYLDQNYPDEMRSLDLQNHDISSTADQKQL